jgi:hypothetical protein
MEMTMGANMNLTTFNHHKCNKIYAYYYKCGRSCVCYYKCYKPNVHHYKCRVKTHYDGFFWTSQF